ncbi:MAG: TetR family transcriptional regulator [Alphaproteobacteria bacterium]|nr:TetR family transcriptional regulator [Alphaproteobacteria bacterium]
MARRSDHSREQLAKMAIEAAAALAARDGLRSITARGVARDIGYTVGTLYNVFDNLDDLVRHMNAATMDALYAHVTAAPIEADPEKALRGLARRYLAFVSAQPRLWSAVIEFEPQDGAPAPDWYRHKAQRLVQLGEDAIADLFSPREAAARRRNAFVLWSALYGLTALAQTTNLAEGDPPTALIDTLVSTYIAGLKAR